MILPSCLRLLYLFSEILSTPYSHAVVKSTHNVCGKLTSLLVLLFQSLRRVVEGITVMTGGLQTVRKPHAP